MTTETTTFDDATQINATATAELTLCDSCHAELTTSEIDQYGDVCRGCYKALREMLVND